MPAALKRRQGLGPAHVAARRKLREQLAQRDRALQQWLTAQLDGDAATAHLVWWVGTLHAGLLAWRGEATRAHVLPVPGAAGVSGTAEPDHAIARALAPDLDAADLDHLAGRLLDRVVDLHGWYSDQVRAAGVAASLPQAGMSGYLARWTGDGRLGWELARCLELHADLKRADPARRKAAEVRWRRLAGWYVRRLDGGG